MNVAGGTPTVTGKEDTALFFFQFKTKNVSLPKFIFFLNDYILISHNTIIKCLEDYSLPNSFLNVFMAEN